MLGEAALASVGRVAEGTYDIRLIPMIVFSHVFFARSARPLGRKGRIVCSGVKL